MAADIRATESPQLPIGWVPEGPRVQVFALFDAQADTWESVVPEFSISGTGASADEAIENALELLHDHLYLCAREGQSFEQSRRGMGWRWALSAARAILGLWLRERREHPVRPVRLARRPLSPAH